MLKKLKNIFCKIVQYIFPPRCIKCRCDTLTDNYFCPKCWGKVIFINEPFCNVCSRTLPINMNRNLTCLSCIKAPPYYDKAIGLLKYNEHTKSLVYNLKYYDKTIIGMILSRLLYVKYQTIIREYDVIIPVPMHRFKRFFRLYNQSQTIASALSQESGIPMCLHVLYKNEWTKSQTKLNKSERVKNVSDSFSISEKYIKEIKNKRVVLIDDVITTGATANACAKLLKKEGGAKSVLVIAIAIA